MYQRFPSSAFAAALACAFVAAGSAVCAIAPDQTPAATGITARLENGYVQVGDRFYLVGGIGRNRVEIFDPAADRWTAGAFPPVDMHHFQAVAYGNKLYVVGAMTGGYPTEPPLPNIYIYDPAADSWTVGPEIPADRRRGGAGVVVHDGLIYVVAGIRNGHTDGHVAWMDTFDPRTGQWQKLPDAPRARDHFQAAVIGGRLYAAGGRRSSFATGQTFELTVPEVDVYDLQTKQWSTLPAAANIPTPRAGCTAVVVNGKLLIMGGESGRQSVAHSEVEEFDPATGRWTTLAPLAMGRHATQGILRDRRIFLAAGSRNRGSSPVNSQEIYTVAARP
jgi:N-acetylneuraminic acid mutarotase